jgi:hypothetical protein
MTGLVRIASAIVGIAGAIVMVALTPIIFVITLPTLLWIEVIGPMIRRWRDGDRPASEEELRKIIEQDRAKNPDTYHTPRQ